MIKDKKELDKLFEAIPDGHHNPLVVPNKEVAFRNMVAEANTKGDCIINVRKGYYRPIPGDEIDEREFSHYTARELHRARAIQFKRLNMIDAFDQKRYERLVSNG